MHGFLPLGGLELVCTGDTVTIDVEGRTMNYAPKPNRAPATSVAEALATKRAEGPYGCVYN